MGKRKKIIIIPIGIAACLILVVLRHSLFLAILPFVYSKASLTSAAMRGISIGGLAKPIYAVFQFTFGYDLEPTENIVVTMLFCLIAVGFLYRCWRLRGGNACLFNATII